MLFRSSTVLVGACTIYDVSGLASVCKTHYDYGLAKTINGLAYVPSNLWKERRTEFFVICYGEKRRDNANHS